MKFKMVMALTVAVGALAGSSAMAADDAMKVEKPIRLLAGIFSPSQGGGGTRTSIGVSYDFMKSTATNPAVYGVYLDYIWKKISGVNTSLTGVGVNGRWYLDSANAASKAYAGLGVGSYTAKSGGSSSKIGGKIELGYELNNGWLLSVDHTVIQKVNGANPSGTNVRVGYRF